MFLTACSLFFLAKFCPHWPFHGSQSLSSLEVLFFFSIPPQNPCTYCFFTPCLPLAGSFLSFKLRSEVTSSEKPFFTHMETPQNTIFSYYSWNKSLLAIILFIHLTGSFLPSSTVRTAQEQRPAGLGSILAPARRTQHVGETQNIFI